MLGAAGGVGLAAVQIGKVVGAVVIAVARCVCIFHCFSCGLVLYVGIAFYIRY